MSNDEENTQIWATEEDLHPHLQSRTLQRGIALPEIQQTLNEGWKASDAKLGTQGKVMVFSYHAEWEGQFYEEKEVTVSYKTVDTRLVLLTVKARYEDFFRGESK